MAILIRVDGQMDTFHRPDPLALEDLQEKVGGYIQVLYFQDGTGRLMVINEEGKFEGLQPNEKASVIAWEQVGIARGDYIAGNAIILQREEME